MASLQISDSERTLMRIIWEQGGTALFASIMDAVEKRNLEWKRTTVLTFLSRLVEKGLLSVRKVGRRNEYRALVNESDYMTVQTEIFLDKVYEGNVAGLVNTLLRRDQITQEEREALLRFWQEEDRDA